MSWIKEANKLGDYIGTYYGFRLYCINQPYSTQRIVSRNGEQWRETNFHPGWYVAINKYDEGFEGESKTDIIFKCQVAQINEKYDTSK